jgi:hypothetical protein
MKLSVQDVAKKTGLSVSTVRQYSWRMRLGTKKGTRKYFTPAEVKRLGSGRRAYKKTGKRTVKKAAAGKKRAARGKR